MQQDPKTNGLYDRDFYSWAVRQGEALRLRDLNAIDWDNVIEEIEGLARQERRNWRQLCSRIMENLLKIEYCGGCAGELLLHWASETEIARCEMAELIRQSPGLKGQYAGMFADAWKLGRSGAVKNLLKHDLEQRGGDSEGTLRDRQGLLPEECPYSFDQVTAFDPATDREPRKDIWPPAAAGILNANLGTNYPLLRDS